MVVVGATVVVVVVVVVVVAGVDGGWSGKGARVVVLAAVTPHDDIASMDMMMMVRRIGYLRDRQTRPEPSSLRVVSASAILLNWPVLSSHRDEMTP
jgi:hypothetical protein